MTWLEWLFLGIYVAIALFTARRVAGAVAWSYNHYPDLDNIMGGIICGVIAGAVWPVFLPIYAVSHDQSRFFLVEKVFYSPHPKEKMLEKRR